MKKEELEKYIGELSPELQEKIRECKTMEEFNTLLAENDVELSDDVLEAVAGGCGTTKGYKYSPVRAQMQALQTPLSALLSLSG